jgi:hypothetical protein
LHPLWLGEPFGDGDLIAMFGEGAPQPRVVTKESNDFAMAGARAITEGLDIALSQRMEPTPRLPQRARRACLDRLYGRLARC